MGNNELNAAENTTFDFEHEYRWTEPNVLLSPRHRVPRDVEHESSTIISVRSVTGTEAPVAFVSTDAQWVRGDFVDAETEYRVFGGQVWTAITERDEFVTASAEWFAGRASTRVGGETEYMAAHNARLLWTGYLIVDGLVWAGSNEPQYEVQCGGLGGNHGSTYIQSTERYTTRKADEHYFAADEYELALAHALDLAEGRGDTRSIDRIKAFTPIHVLIPEAVGTTMKRAVRLKYVRPYSLTVETFRSALASFRDQMIYEAGAMTLHDGATAYDYSKLTERQTSDYKEYIKFGADHGLI
jgi:hypothetical protein